MFSRFIISFIILVLVACPKKEDLSDNNNNTLTEGIYEVNSTTINNANCDIEGTSVENSVNFFNVDKAVRKGYRVTTCSGGTLTEVSCPSLDTYINEELATGWQKLSHEAGIDTNQNDNTICILQAYKYKVLKISDTQVRYEHSYWRDEITDFTDECSLDTAVLYHANNSITCSSYTVRIGTVVNSQ